MMAQNEQTTEEHSMLEQQSPRRLNHPAWCVQRNKDVSNCWAGRSWHSQFHRCSPYNLKLSPSVCPYLYQSWYFCRQLNPHLPACLPIHLTPLLLCLRFGFCWPLCAFVNYIYLLTYLVKRPSQLSCTSEVTAGRKSQKYSKSNTRYCNPGILAAFSIPGLSIPQSQNIGV